jgi:hypothetical protein
MDFKTLSSLPEHLQVILATGYIGYSIAQSGFRDKERKDELFYGILVYGLFGYIIYDLAKPHYQYFIIPSILGATFTAIVALLWRKYLRDFWNNLLHSSSFSNEDNIKGVWPGLTQNTKVAPTQITVLLKNGTSLECNDVQSFSNAPFPRYYADNDGNIAIYVSRKIFSDGTHKDMTHVRDDNWGDRITYIPKYEIASIGIRFIPK